MPVVHACNIYENEYWTWRNNLVVFALNDDLAYEIGQEIALTNVDTLWTGTERGNW